MGSPPPTRYHLVGQLTNKGDEGDGVSKEGEGGEDITMAGQPTKRKDRATQPMDHGRLR